MSPKRYWYYSSIPCPFLFTLLYPNSFTVDNSISPTVQPGSQNERHWWMWQWLRSCIKNFKGIHIWYLMIHSASSSILQRALVSYTNSLIVKLIISKSLICTSVSVHFKWVLHNSLTNFMPIFMVYYNLFIFPFLLFQIQTNISVRESELTT